MRSTDRARKEKALVYFRKIPADDYENFENKNRPCHKCATTVIMPNLRVRLEFPDGEKYWLFIDSSKIETIQDVIDDIDQKYSVVCEKLLLDDAQLYCKETIGILQERDLIR